MPVVSPTVGFVDAQRYGALLVEAQFTIFQGGIPVGTPYTAAVSTGSFTIDRNSEFRRTGQLTIELQPDVPPPPLLPANPDSLLAPFGTELFITTAISASGDSIPAGTAPSIIPNGLFVISDSTVDDTTIDLTVTLDLKDRGWTIAQRALKNPYNFPATDTGLFADEIRALLNAVWAQQSGVQPLQYNIVPTTAVVPEASYDQGSDPWQAALDMATAVGYELFFDVNGIVVGRPIPNPYATAPCWNFTDDAEAVYGLAGSGSTALFGDAYSTPVEVSVQMTRDGVFNDIIIQGTGDANAATYNGNGLETAPPPILAEAADTNSQSPTYVGGALGDVPSFISSSLITSQGAQAMANTQLQAALSSAWQCTLSIAPNPMFDVDDVVVVTRPRVGLNNAVMVLDTITQTFNYADLMMITGRILTNYAL